jgi:inhibitor of KinA
VREDPPPDIVRVVPAGDAALVLTFPARLDPAINDRAMAAAAALRTQWSAILRDIVVGYCTVTVAFDPLAVDAPWLESEMLTTAGLDAEGLPRRTARVVDVPVCYEEDFAPDLADVAAYGGCSIEEVVARHSERTYRVYMVGFVPGFAYLAEVDERIAAPRRASPRALVPAGAVGIAGPQTGVYPTSTPGGWNIIGRTPLQPFNLQREQPCLFEPGDTVRFVRISRGDLERAC